MESSFFEKPILNSPYAYPGRHWELDNSGQPTHQIIEHRRIAEFITANPQAQKAETHPSSARTRFQRSKRYFFRSSALRKNRRDD